MSKLAVNLREDLVYKIVSSLHEIIIIREVSCGSDIISKVLKQESSTEPSLSHVLFLRLRFINLCYKIESVLKYENLDTGPIPRVQRHEQWQNISAVFP